MKVEMILLLKSDIYFFIIMYFNAVKFFSELENFEALDHAFEFPALLHMLNTVFKMQLKHS